MKRKLEASDKTVAYLANHPRQVLQRVRQVVTDADNIQWSFNVNDLESARNVQIRTILKCLQKGELTPGSLKDGGEYVRGEMTATLGGMIVRVEFFLGPAHSGITVLSATAEEEE